MKKMMINLCSIFALLISPIANAEDWSPPIQCTIETRIDNTFPEVLPLEGAREAERIVQIQTKNIGQNGQLLIEDFHFKFRVILTSSNTYSMSIHDLSIDTTTSINVIASSGTLVNQELMLTKDYAEVNGLGVLFPRFTLKFKCDLRDQNNNPIPDLTPGPPQN